MTTKLTDENRHILDPHLIDAGDLETQVDELFEEPKASDDVVRSYLDYLLDNLKETEKGVGSCFFKIVLTLVAFLLLNGNAIEKVSILGIELKNTGEILLLFPLVIAYLTHQKDCKIFFAHELKVAIAALYHRIEPRIHSHGLDMLIHPPSTRNIESYFSKSIGSRAERLIKTSTSIVALTFGLLPPVAVVFCLVSTFRNPHVSFYWWLPTAILCAIPLVYIFFRGCIAPHGRGRILTERPRTFKRRDSKADNKGDGGDA